MRNILKYGCYSVGASARVAVQSVHDLISMRLEERDKKLLKKIYTLDELRDLESKLVLICGNKEESRTEVDHFLNVSSIQLRVCTQMHQYKCITKLLHNPNDNHIYHYFICMLVI